MTTSPQRSRRARARAIQPRSASPSPQSAAPTWRDPWLLLCALAVVPLAIHAWGALLGEPFADDYHFLHRALLDPNRSLWDGGGAVVYWRPLARQVYYGLLGPVMLEAPRTIALLHAALLALAGVLLYRVLRRDWSAPWAAAAASFPLLADSSRALLLWPSTIQDLGAFVFSVVALHEARFGRRLSALAGLLAALLCKEVAVVTALLLPWMPGIAGERKRWIAGTAAVVLLWGAAYAWVFQQGDVVFQGHLEAIRASWPHRFIWSLGLGLEDAFELGAIPARWAVALAVGTAVVVGSAAALALRRPQRLAGARAWILWGLAWFVACSVLLAEVWPAWGPFRSVFSMAGIGIATIALLRAAGPVALVALVALRLAGLALSGAPAARIEREPPDSNDGLKLRSLVRLQRLARSTREALLTAHPTVPRGARIVVLQRPMMGEHAFAGDRALQVWYRDTTLRWSAWSEVLARPEPTPFAAVEYEHWGPKQSAVVDGAAVAEYIAAIHSIQAGNSGEALTHLARADSLQRDRRASTFLGNIAGKRALALVDLGDAAAARRDAEASLALWPDGGDARYVLALLLAADGRRAEAHAQIDTFISRYPFDPSGPELKRMIDSRAPSGE